MLILPPGHNRPLSTPRRLQKRERWILGGVSGVCAVVLVVAVIALTGAGSGPGRGCFSVTFASSLGAQQIAGCGNQARSICRSLDPAGGYSPQVAELIAAQCRRLKLKVGP